MKQEYFSINPKPHMMFQLEKITIENGKVMKTEQVAETYLQILMANLYKDVLNRMRND